MNKNPFLEKELAAALKILKTWQQEAEQSGRSDLLYLLNTLQSDFEDQARLETLNPATLRKTLYFLGALIQSHPLSQHRFARTLHHRHTRGKTKRSATPSGQPTPIKKFRAHKRVMPEMKYEEQEG